MTTTKTDPREALAERLGRPENYSIDYDFARHFAKLTNRPETSVLANVRELCAEYERAGAGSPRGRYERSLRTACESIWEWFRQGENGEWNTSHMISFIESHCRQAVWAVLLGEESRRVNHPELDDPMNEATA